jgi:hypothetical protein
MTAMFRGSRPTRTVGATKHVHIFQKHQRSPQQPPSRSAVSPNDRRALLEAAAMASNLLEKIKGK